MRTLGMVKCEGEGKYLGLPYFVGQSKKRIFPFVKDKVWKQLQGWKEKLLCHKLGRKF